MPDRPRAPGFDASNPNPIDSRAEHPSEPPRGRGFDSAHGWELVARAGSAMRDARDPSELRGEILAASVGLSGLQRALWIDTAEGGTDPAATARLGRFGAGECASICDAVWRNRDSYPRPLEWMDHLDANPLFAPGTWDRRPSACLLLTLEGGEGSRPVVYADGSVTKRPSTEYFRALEYFVGDAGRQIRTLAELRPFASSESSSFREQIGAAERAILRRALDRDGGNVSRAAGRLNISRQHFHNLLKKHGIKRR